jgi:hypothetical protein
MRFAKNLIFFSLLLFLTDVAHAQKLVSADYIGSVSRDQLIIDFGQPIIRNGVDMYKVLYETNDIHGALDTASGLMIFPDEINTTFPMLIYQHGTVGSRDDVPSNLQGGYQLAQLYAAMGYVTTAADYLGLGTSRGIHPYIHADSEASAAIDFHVVAKQFAEDNGLFVNDQLFITGYSQGGQAAMAAFRTVEQDYQGILTVTAAAPMSGPYSLSGKMFEFTLGDEEYGFVAYLASVALSFQLAYGDIFQNDDLGTLFKPQYVPLIEQYKNEELDLFDLNDMMIAELIKDVGASIPKFLFLDDVREEIFSNPDHPINVALRLNDTYDWAPQAPTKIYYCTEDEQVFYENAILAEQVMTANGAPNVESKNSGATNHTGCVFPSVINAILWFGSFQDITSDVDDFDLQLSAISVRPNPATDIINVELPTEGDWHIALFDAMGRKVFADSKNTSSAFSFNVNLPAGFYNLRATDGKTVESVQLVIN